MWKGEKLLFNECLRWWIRWVSHFNCCDRDTSERCEAMKKNKIQFQFLQLNHFQMNSGCDIGRKETFSCSSYVEKSVQMKCQSSSSMDNRWGKKKEGKKLKVMWHKNTTLQLVEWHISPWRWNADVDVSYMMLKPVRINEFMTFQLEWIILYKWKHFQLLTLEQKKNEMKRTKNCFIFVDGRMEWVCRDREWRFRFTGFHVKWKFLSTPEHISAMFTS